MKKFNDLEKTILYFDSEIFKLQTNGGISRIYKAILSILSNTFPEIKIKILLDSPKYPTQLQEDFPIEILSFPIYQWLNKRTTNIENIFPSIKQIIKNFLIRNNKNAIWHSTYYGLPPLAWKGLYSIFVYDLIHENYFIQNKSSDFSKILKKKKRAIQSADIILAISKTVKNKLIDFYNIHPGKVHVVHLAAGDDFQILPLTLKPNIYKQYILYVGKRDGYKNASAILYAYSNWKQNNNIDLVFVGPPWTNEEIDTINSLSISSRLHIFSNTNDQELCELYNQAHAFVYPSLHEGFGIPLLEAMRCGCLILASNIPSTKEIAEGVPIYFDPNNLNEIINAFDISLNKDIAKEKIMRGLKLTENYSWAKTATKFVFFHKHHNSTQR